MKHVLSLVIIVFVAYLGHGQCTDNSNVWSKSWTSCQKRINPNPLRPESHWILYEFNTNHYIDSSHIWNSNRPGESLDGIKDIIVDYSLDGEHWTELSTYSVAQAPESETYDGVSGPMFGNVYIKKILITVLNTHGSGDCATVGEIIFSINADECHGIIDDCGACNGPGAATWYVDADGDGKGDINHPLINCHQPDGYVDNYDDDCDNGQLGWAEIFPIFETSCNGCHIANTAGGLSLGSYESFLMGGNSCGASIIIGSTLVGVITIDNYAGCSSPISFPAMNDRTTAPLGPVELDMLQRWINGGAPEFCSEFCPQDDTVSITFDQGSIAYRQTSNEISSSSTIELESIVTFDAGSSILLDTGFTVAQGGQFIGKIDGCDEN